jgi:hypothetical protein
MTPEEIIQKFNEAFNALNEATTSNDKIKVLGYINDRTQIVKYIAP